MTEADFSAVDRHWLGEARIRGYSRIIVAMFALAAGLLVLSSLPNLVDPLGKPLGNDFVCFWSAARLALTGHPEASYDWSALNAVEHAAVPALPYFLTPWYYPPTFLLAVMPFGLLPYPAALFAFVLATAALWAALIGRALPRRAWVVAAATPVGLITLLMGQNALLTAALAGFALLLLERRPVVAGVLIGLLAIKPQLAALFPLALLAEGHWRTIAAASATLAVFCAASLVAFGWGTFAAFLAHLPPELRLIDGNPATWSYIPSPYVFALALGAPVVAAWAFQAAVALTGAVCVWCAWRRPAAAFEAKAAVLMSASLLVSPHIAYYDLTWAALAVGWLALLGAREGFRRGEREILLLVWLLPVLMPPAHALFGGQPVGLPALLLLLFAAVTRAAPGPWRRGIALARPAGE